MTLERQIVIAEDRSDPMVGMLYVPDRDARSCLVMCAPIFEERKAAQRPLVELARTLARAGTTVLRFDYRGCGDSAGDFAEFTPDDWRRDIRQACRWLTARAAGVPLGLFGLRVGAALAFEAAAGIDNAFLVLWQPVVNGRTYLHEELRKTLMKQMLTFGGSRITRETIVKQLEGGSAVDFDGYSLTPDTYQELCAIDLLPAAARPEPRRPVRIDEFTANGAASEPVSELEKALENMHGDITRTTWKHQPFWNLIGYVDCSAAAQSAVHWLASKGWAVPHADGPKSTESPTQ